MIGQDFPEFLLEGNEPCLPLSSLHSSIVFPVDVHSIQVVVLDEFAKFNSAVSGVDSIAGGEFCGSKGADHDFNSCVIVGLFQIFLNLEVIH